ncbi:FAD-dependent oxidoreductase [Microbacterium trichothecenolyticum]|uniref:3-hydroxybenzoate 6-hydroxylase 1 n=1 Tax=Microbacterium trichothecenolyticum TaxID=69370 RepID=A0A0M2HLL7_MICTR|nr:NAD(P)/FAD-dependent oxidoreductase [Microbacterium trichothecenolyticum]KJL45795.1 3-hydroxybenzoate 6-hydroxylase 1 [Microbacterium trichothecenolyticum]
MNPNPDPIVIIGAGPAGMATALALHKVGQRPILLERYREARPAGNILNLWPPPIKALQEMGVDTVDLGAPCHTTFRGIKGNIRADVKIPRDVVDAYGGGFIGLLRPELYRRMLAAMPEGVLRTHVEVVGLDDHGDGVTVTLGDDSVIDAGVVVGADGIDSMVRGHLWGPSEKREHKLHIIGGYTFAAIPGVERNEVVLTHDRSVQGTYSSIRDNGRDGIQWWVLEAWDPAAEPPTDLRQHALSLARRFPGPLRALVQSTEPGHFQRWPIRDRKPLRQWSKGRITLAGDAAHATSPYAAYGAGMSIGDGYTLGQELAGIDLSDTAAVIAALTRYDERRIAHTTSQVQQAFVLGKVFHHAPAFLRPVRDFILDSTPMLQKQVGEKSPGEIVAQLDEMGAGLVTR